jgi:hypothetical protein
VLAFLFSAIIHAVGDIVASQKGRPVQLLRSGSMAFFMMQVVGIALEEVVFRFGRGKGNGPVRRALGLVWVWAWFAVVMPPWISAAPWTAGLRSRRMFG